MRRFASIFFILTVLFFLNAPLIAYAQFDQRCFTESQCKNNRGLASDQGDITDFFYTGKDAQVACGVAANGGHLAGTKDESGESTGESVGFCLAAGAATSKIAIGGKKTFTDIGDFIKYFYQYGMWIAGILAVAIIIIAGFIWTLSGGNSDSISSAKKKIGGAVTGLLLLSLSYVILNTINPYLVELRLPKTWMINTVGLAAPFCSQIKDLKLAYLGKDKLVFSDEEKKTKLAEALTAGFTIDPQAGGLSTTDLKAIEIIKADNTLSFIEQTAAVVKIIENASTASGDPTKSAVCGNRYFVQNSNGQTCVGEFCSASKTCVPFTTENATSGDEQSIIDADEVVRKSDCWSGQLVIDYKVNDLFEGLINNLSENWVGKLDSDNDGNDWIQDESGDGMDTTIQVYPVCQITTPSSNEAANFNNDASSEDRIQILKAIGQKPFVIDGSNNVTPEVKILSIKRPDAFREHLIRYTFSNEDIQKLYNCPIPTAGSIASGKPIYAKTVGIVIKNQINVNWNGFDADPMEWGSDALVYTYQDTSGKGTAAPWIRKEMDLNNFGDFGDFDYFLPKGYIPIEDIDGTKPKGLYLDFTLPPDTIKNLGAAVSDSYTD